jgi:hypothetical protein
VQLDSDWEFFYTEGLVGFAGATDDRREAASMLMETPEALPVTRLFRAGELERAQTFAREGLAAALGWHRLSATTKRAFLKKLAAKMPDEVTMAARFSLGDDGGLQLTTVGAPDMSLMDHVALGIALLVGDHSPWRGRLAHCNLKSCGRVFVRAISKGKPSGTCSYEHAKELHRAQMRKANAGRSR